MVRSCWSSVSFSVASGVCSARLRACFVSSWSRESWLGLDERLNAQPAAGYTSRLESRGGTGVASGDASLGVAASARETMAAKASRLSSESASRRRGGDRSWAGMTGMTGMAVTSVMSFICMSVVSTTAQASCGDWLAGHAMEASAAVPATVLPPSGAADERSAPPRRACRGPSCGRGPALPFAPTGAPVAPVVHERDAVLPSAGAAVVPGRGIVIPADAPPLASALAERLERPPRRG